MATQRRDGRWMARRQIEGQKLTAYGQTAEEAEVKLRELILDLENTRSTLKGSRLHDVAARLWFPMIASLNHRTQIRYTRCYQKWVAPTLGALSITEIRVRHCQDLINEAGKELAPKSLLMVKSILHQILEAAYDNEMIHRNPAKSVKLPPMPEKRVRVVTVDEAGALLDRVEGTELSCPVFLALVLGLRLGEALGLKWSDLDRQKGTLSIERQRQEFKFGRDSGRAPEVRDVPLKTTGSRRVLHLTPGLIAEIDRRGNLDSEYICTRHTGRPWLPTRLTKCWIEQREALGMSGWTFHDLRHGAAGLIYAATGDMLIVQTVLGHSRPDMSFTYTDLANSRRAEAGKKLSNLLAFG